MSYFLQIVAMEFIDSSDEETENSGIDQDVSLNISENKADTNYMMAGTEVPEPPDEISKTKPLSLILEEKMNDKLVPTAVLSMEGDLKNCLDDQDQEARLSSPEEEVLSGAFPCLLGHPESWSSTKVSISTIINGIFLFWSRLKPTGF